MNAIRVAAEFAQTGVNAHLEHEFTLRPVLAAQADATSALPLQ
jgi:hypothetical protein